jgi:hypothetical protein
MKWSSISKAFCEARPYSPPCCLLTSFRGCRADRCRCMLHMQLAGVERARENESVRSRTGQARPQQSVRLDSPTRQVWRTSPNNRLPAPRLTALRPKRPLSV